MQVVPRREGRKPSGENGGEGAGSSGWWTCGRGQVGMPSLNREAGPVLWGRREVWDEGTATSNTKRCTSWPAGKALTGVGIIKNSRYAFHLCRCDIFPRADTEPAVSQVWTDNLKWQISSKSQSELQSNLPFTVESSLRPDRSLIFTEAFQRRAESSLTFQSLRC